MAVTTVISCNCKVDRDTVLVHALLFETGLNEGSSYEEIKSEASNEAKKGGRRGKS